MTKGAQPLPKARGPSSSQGKETLALAGRSSPSGCHSRGPLLPASCGAGPEVQGPGSLELEARAPQMAVAWATNR